MAKNVTLILCFFQSLAGLLFGWEQSVISGLMIMEDFQRRFGTCDAITGVCAISSSRQSIITGIFSIGCFVGALSSGWISGKLGLRTTNLISLIVFLAGIAIEVSSGTQYGQLVGGRVLTGYGVGTLSGLVPVFQAEAAPPKWRGVVTGSFQGCVTLGIFISNCVNDGMRNYSGSASWRVPIAIQLAFGIFLATGFAFSPESPGYLASKGKNEQAKAAIARLRGLNIEDQAVEEEYELVMEKKAQEGLLGEASYKECFSMKDRILLRTAIGCVVQIGQQLTGINFFFSYGVQFFQSSGLDDPYVTQIILSVVNFVCTWPGMYIVYRFGRRQVLLYGAAVMFIGQIVVGVVGRTNEGEAVAGKVLIAFSCVFIAAFAATWGPLAWVVAAESFPSRLAPKCVTLATASNWGINTVISFVVPLITNADGANLRSLICLIWAGSIALSFAFVFFVVPESKGLSVDQIDVLYHARIPAWRSAAWAAEHREEFATIDTTAGNVDKANLRRAEQSKIDQKEISHTDSGVATPATVPTTPYGTTPRASIEAANKV